MKDLEKYIRNIPDFPKLSIQFKDITPLLKAPKILNQSVEMLIEPFLKKEVTAVAGMEARGFIFGALAAHKLNTSFIPLRKPDKLPYDVKQTSYDLEYGSAEIEVQKDSLSVGTKVLIHDDLIATGGTAIAAAQLVNQTGAQTVAFAFLVNLTFLEADKRLKDISETIISIVNY